MVTVEPSKLVRQGFESRQGLMLLYTDDWTICNGKTGEDVQLQKLDAVCHPNELLSALSGGIDIDVRS
jgi:hypothetical protein